MRLTCFDINNVDPSDTEGKGHELFYACYDSFVEVFTMMVVSTLFLVEPIMMGSYL